ncbi:long-chain-fatty-acid--CoA ligase [Gordonia sp. CPCC 206044]|uniref:long-chain-fatty-acid--CoA ligase n=1 Tax=Gordonia sp. CPCC 206044 TaxID=3140793 RepID=UPI003AF3E590
MGSQIVQGLPSTHGDRYQLNTTTIIRHAARTYPEREIVYRAANGEWERYSYADAYDRVGRAAGALRAIGVGPADVVGVLDWNSKRHFELYWAIPGVAAAMLQMNLRLGTEDLGYVVAHSRASVILVDETLIPVAEALAPNVSDDITWVIMTDRPLSAIATTLPDVRHWEDLVAAAQPVTQWPVIDENSTYSACYTTGTTGRPKGVYYSHRGIVLHTMMQVGQLGMNSDDAVMPITPMFHAQTWGLVQSAIYSNAKLVLPGRYSAEDTAMLVDAMIDEQVTVANGAPAIFAPMMDYIKTLAAPPDFSRARLLSGASEPPLSLMRDFDELTGADIIHAYGATETTPMVTINGALKPSLRASFSEDQKWDLKRSQGLPITGIDIRVVDAEDNDVPRDGVSQGEVLLRGPWITERYHDLDDDADKFVDGYWRSGDVGRIDEHGYLKLTDRIKDVVKSGGEWISSIDMENALVAHPKIREVAVIGVTHPKWQERPVALVVTVDGSHLPLDDVTAVLTGKFAKWQLPDTVLFLDELPRTSVGKLDKKRMRTEYGDLYQEDR